MRIRTFILATSAAVAIGFFGASYWLLGNILENTVRDSARQSSNSLAQVTFTSMYQLMSTGWQRKQAEAFVHAVASSVQGTPTTVQIYRGPVVETDYGRIDQPPFDDGIRKVFAQGQAVTEAPVGGMRYLMPLVANTECQRCHFSAKQGDVLGAIEVKQDFAPLLAQSRRQFLLWFGGLTALLMLFATIAVWRVSRRIEAAVDGVSQAVSKVNGVADLQDLELAPYAPGFIEFEPLFANLGQLVRKLRDIAVDKGVLRFEIGLLEKFVITSEVVRDWGEYVARLLAEINQVMPTHMLFSVFQVDDEVFDLEIFWSRTPTDETRQMVERHVRSVIQAGYLSELSEVTLHHHFPSSSEHEPLVLEEREVVLHTKTLIVDHPKIGGIVGIGVNANAAGDETLRLVMDSVLSTMLNVIGSVKAIHKYTRDMEYYATRDPLTDLYNRRVFWELFEYEVARARRHNYRFALLVIDLDNFKLVNDNYGHSVGDRYLQGIAHAVRSTLRPGDIFARYGGDEFVLVLPETELNAAEGVARRIMESITALRIDGGDGMQIGGSASIGLAVYPLHAGNAKDLFLFADNMMYKAKASGKNQVGVPTEEDVAEVFRDMTATTMQVVSAVNEGRIVPFFQPIMALAENRIVACEVLSRLSLDGQHIEAGRFIEYAEKAGVIHRLDIMVMDRALRAVAAAKFAGYIFINLSPRALALANFLQTLKRTVGECGVPPGQIVFEITERDTVKNVVVLERLVAELKLEGFKLAIDDFGSGFSSFQYLRRLPVDFLKIEGDFVANILENAKDRAFVETIWRLAADLGIKVIAEHVESIEVLDELRSIGVDLAQGYYIGRPQRELGGDLRFPLV
ncbi:putative bifunctional diguanylate cyclase/phosphodiesterase [Sulfuricystis multivorans]|uniref:putative bifunctional diguanylate cyclase/phosphodiesterase n=1 Tax=Sulfuricystis multivorans TaxID=2211108 RepID=UPI000F8487A7|nr:EAL domain-containing protein [Sulfuricystis multivorans]